MTLSYSHCCGDSVLTADQISNLLLSNRVIAWPALDNANEPLSFFSPLTYSRTSN